MGKSPLSDWEVAEMAHHARCGWSLYELASHYGLSERSVQRMLRRMSADECTKEGRVRRDNG